LVSELSWDDCLAQGIVYEVPFQSKKSVNLFELAKVRLDFWSNQNTAPASLKLEAYYEIIKELLFAHLYKKGFNCSNHVCLISFCGEFFNFSKQDIFKLHKLRKLRNEINYRGLFIDSLEGEEDFILYVINVLISVFS